MTEFRTLSDSDLADLATRLRAVKWSWRLADFPALAQSFGWQVEPGDTITMFDSGFGMASGNLLVSDGVVDDINVMVTDFVDDDGVGRERIRDCFARFTGVLSEALGAPTSLKPGDIPEVRWAGANTTVLLRALSVTVVLHIITNEALYLQDVIAETEDDDDLDGDI